MHKWETKWTKMGLNGELKYIFIQQEIIFILKQHWFIKKNIPVQTRGYAHSCHAEHRCYRGGLKCVYVNSIYVCLSVCLSGESLYVGLASGTEIVVVASWWHFDVVTVSYFQFQHPEFQQLILIPSVLNFSLQPRLILLQYTHLQTYTHTPLLSNMVGHVFECIMNT